MTLKEQLSQLCEEEFKETGVPAVDGRYKLPDRRVLIKKDDKFILIGHRDKKKYRQLDQSMSKEQLVALLQLKCYGGYREEKLIRLEKDELLRLYYPRPKQIFHYKWLSSESPPAMRMAELISRAKQA